MTKLKQYGLTLNRAGLALRMGYVFYDEEITRSSILFRQLTP